MSVAFSRSPLMLATNCWIETLNSSTLQAKYMQVTLKQNTTSRYITYIQNNNDSLVRGLNKNDN